MTYYWAGVCLNYELQAKSLRLPATQCLRNWAALECRRIVDDLQSKAKDAAKEGIDEKFGPEFRGLYDRAKRLAEMLEEDEDTPEPVRKDARDFLAALDRFWEWLRRAEEVLPAACDEIFKPQKR